MVDGLRHRLALEDFRATDIDGWDGEPEQHSGLSILGSRLALHRDYVSIALVRDAHVKCHEAPQVRVRGALKLDVGERRTQRDVNPFGAVSVTGHERHKDHRG
jgi:hypothetical protein